MSITQTPATPTDDWFSRTTAAYRSGGGGVELFPPPMAATGRTFNTGTLRCSYFQPNSVQQSRLRTITNVEILCGNVGAAVSLVRIGVWDVATLALLASTADFSGVLAVAALNRALTVALAMPTTPFYVGVLAVFATTSPQFSAMITGGSAGAGVSHAPLYSVIQTGLADLPNPLVPAGGGDASLVWFGLN